jgi:hypothetical protein
MKITRRDFIKSSLILSYAPVFSPISLYAKAKDRGQFHPAYYWSEKEGRLDLKLEEAYAMFENCRFAPGSAG